MWFIEVSSGQLPAGSMVTILLYQWTAENFCTSCATASVYVCSLYWGFDKRRRRVSCSSVRILLIITEKGGQSDLVSGQMRHCHKRNPKTYQLHVRLKAMQDKQTAQRQIIKRVEGWRSSNIWWRIESPFMKELRADLSQGMFASILWRRIFSLLVRYKNINIKIYRTIIFCLLLSMGVKLGRWQ